MIVLSIGFCIINYVIGYKESAKVASIGTHDRTAQRLRCRWQMHHVLESSQEPDAVMTRCVQIGLSAAQPNTSIDCYGDQRLCRGEWRHRDQATKCATRWQFRSAPSWTLCLHRSGYWAGPPSSQQLEDRLCDSCGLGLQVHSL